MHSIRDCTIRERCLSGYIDDHRSKEEGNCSKEGARHSMENGHHTTEEGHHTTEEGHLTTEEGRHTTEEGRHNQYIYFHTAVNGNGRNLVFIVTNLQFVGVVVPAGFSDLRAHDLFILLSETSMCRHN